jgi:hypothetical protein
MENFAPGMRISPFLYIWAFQTALDALFYALLFLLGFADSSARARVREHAQHARNKAKLFRYSTR